MKRIIYILLAAAVTSTALTACFPLAVGAVGGGALVVADRRTPGAQLDDQTIELKASSNIRDVYAYNVHVNVTAYNRRVLLTGSRCPAKPIASASSRSRAMWRTCARCSTSSRSPTARR